MSIFRKAWNLVDKLREKTKSDKRLSLLVKIFVGILFANLLINLVRHLPLVHSTIGSFLRSNALVEKLYHIIRDPFFIFIEHSWIELFCGIVIYFLLEDKFQDINKIPQKVDKRDHAKILQEISDNALKEVRILDTAIYSFTKEYELFEDSMNKTLAREGMVVKILLLHPDTYAAEQRSKDLTVDTRTFLENMKTGLGQLHKFIDSLKPDELKKFQIKLYKTTPMMIYTSWDEDARFALLHPNKLADESDNFIAVEQSPLIMSFKNYFDELWNYKNGKTVALNQYLFVDIGYKDEVNELKWLTGLYWGGNTESFELPRYLADSNRHEHSTELMSISKKKCSIMIRHDDNISYGTIDLIDAEYDDYKKHYAKSQIKKTFGNKLDTLDYLIFEIRYVLDTQISLINKKLVREKIDLKGYTFVSHNQYDVIFGHGVRKVFDSLMECFDKDIEEDIYDAKAVAFFKKTFPDLYRGKARKRLMDVYQCDITDGVIDVKPLPYNTYPGKYSVTFEGKVYKENTRTFSTIRELSSKTNQELAKNRLDDNLEARKQRLDVLKKLFISTVRSDITYLLGPQDFITQNKSFTVYIHLIRTDVFSGGISSPSPQSNEFSNFAYKSVHLVRRSNIVGGGNEITIKKGDEEIIKDSLLLNDPLDSVFFKKYVTIDGDECIVTDKADDIKLDQRDKEHSSSYDKATGANYGFRDVLIVEYFETNNLMTKVRKFFGK
jgi:phosphotransferase system IIB component